MPAGSAAAVGSEANADPLRFLAGPDVRIWYVAARSGARPDSRAVFSVDEGQSMRPGPLLGTLVPL